MFNAMNNEQVRNLFKSLGKEYDLEAALSFGGHIIREGELKKDQFNLSKLNSLMILFKFVFSNPIFIQNSALIHNFTMPETNIDILTKNINENIIMGIGVLFTDVFYESEARDREPLSDVNYIIKLLILINILVNIVIFFSFSLGVDSWSIYQLEEQPPPWPVWLPTPRTKSSSRILTKLTSGLLTARRALRWGGGKKKSRRKNKSRKHGTKKHQKRKHRSRKHKRKHKRRHIRKTR